MAAKLSIIVCFIAYIIGLSYGQVTECNLLESGNSAYIDTESESSITTMCSGDTSSLSLWEQYQCEFIQNRYEYQVCWPQRRMSTCDPGQLKGAVFLYHGFSACPNQYNELAPKLQAECYHVYQILTLGHGYNYCDDDPTGPGCVDGKYNNSQMPNQRQPYIDYIYRMIDIIEEEVAIIKECESAADTAFNVESELEVVIGGLSFGAPLTAATVALSGVDGVFTKQILMSPFFGISYGGLDDRIYKCLINTNSFRACLPSYLSYIGFNIDDVDEDQANGLSDAIMDALAFYVDTDKLDVSYETLNLLLRKILEWLVEEPDGIDNADIKETVQNFIDGVMSWGTDCELDIVERNRGGICNFTFRNLFAGASLGAYLIEEVGQALTVNTDVETLLIMVERDGPTRNSLVADYVSLFYGYDSDLIADKVNNCMWFISQECQDPNYQGSIDNTCGVPHSSMGVEDNIGKVPYWLWWNSTYHQGMIDWINGASQSDARFLATTSWTGGPEQCISLDIEDPPSVLIADVPKLAKIGMNIVADEVNEGIRNRVLDYISSVTFVPRGVLELTYGLISSNANADTENDYYEFSVVLDSDGGNIMTTLLENDAFTQIANYSVSYVEVGGTTYNIEESTTTTETPTTTKESGGHRMMMNTSILCLCVVFKAFFL